MDEQKKWYTSKTLWANAIMMIAAIVNGKFEYVSLGPEIQAGILVVVNIILRVITKQEITW